MFINNISKTVLIRILIILILLILLIGASTIQKNEFKLNLLLNRDNDSFSPLNNEILQMNGYIIQFPFRKYYIKGTAIVNETEFTLHRYFYKSPVKPDVDLYTVEMYTLLNDSNNNYVRSVGYILTIGSIVDESFEHMIVTITGYPDPELGFTHSYQAFQIE